MYALFDIGGTKMRIARSIDGITFDEPLRFDTPQKYEEGIALIIDTVRRLSEGGEVVEGIAGGIAGTLDPARLRLVHATHLKDWVQKPLVETLAHTLQAPLYIENDCAVVGLGEAHHGAGKGEPIVAYVTVSTGLGGARIVDGVLDRGGYSFEPGDQILLLDQAGGQVASVEDLVSGTALEARFGKKPYLVDDPSVWEDLARILACALNNTIVHWSPSVVVLGGSMVTGKPAISIERVKEHLKTMLIVYPEPPEIKQATLKDIGGIYGAGVLLRMKHPINNY